MGELIKPLSPHDIYVQLTSGEGTDRLDAAKDAARLQREAQSERADIIRRQADLIAAGWEGTASTSATEAVQPLSTNAALGAVLLATSEELMSWQSESFHTAANSVRPVSSEPPEPDILDMTWPFVDYEKQVTDYQADANHNIEVFRGYDTVSEGHEAGMREYTPADSSGGTIGVADSGDSIEVPDQGQPGDTADPFGERRDPGGPPAGPPNGGPPVGGPPPVSGPLPDTQQSQDTTPSDVVGQPVGPQQGPLPPGQPVSTGPAPGGFGPGLPVGGYSGGGPGSTGGPGARGGMYGGSGGPGSGGPGAAGRGPGVRGGAFGPGMGVLAAEEAAAQRAAAAAAARGGGSGTMAGAPVGAGRGKGDEDEEHRRKVLIEADAEGLFGSDVLTAPEVIGDDEYEDD